jgi:hypothetical protein
MHLPLAFMPPCPTVTVHRSACALYEQGRAGERGEVHKNQIPCFPATAFAEHASQRLPNNLTNHQRPDRKPQTSKFHVSDRHPVKSCLPIAGYPICSEASIRKPHRKAGSSWKERPRIFRVHSPVVAHRQPYLQMTSSPSNVLGRKQPFSPFFTSMTLAASRRDEPFVCFRLLTRSGGRGTAGESMTS